jgi:hypothetical protein
VVPDIRRTARLLSVAMTVVLESGLFRALQAKAASIAMSSAIVGSSAAQLGIVLWVMIFPLSASSTATPALPFLEAASMYRVCLSFLGILARDCRIASSSSPSRPLALHPWLPSSNGFWRTGSTVSIRLSTVNPIVALCI